MTSDQYEIQQVTSIEESPEGIKVGLSARPAALLAPDHPAHDWILRRLRQCQQGRGLLGVWTNPGGKIVDVAGAYRGVVTGLRERPGLAEFEVWFAELDGPMLLATAHPSFANLHQHLVQARESAQPVWYAMKGGYLLDVHAPSAVEEAELSRNIP
jgi:hypothetical protein